MTSAAAASVSTASAAAAPARGPARRATWSAAWAMCSPVPEGLPPVVPGQCPVQPAAGCGFDGMCNGQGGCRKHPDGTLCSDGQCAGAAVVGAKHVQRGQLHGGRHRPLLPLRLRSHDQPLLRPVLDQQPVCGGVLSRRACAARSRWAPSARARRECESGNCADGVCCNVACGGPCVSCREPGKMGQCTPVPVGNPDPHGVCRQEPIESCGGSGVCNGQGGCGRYAAGTICRPATCSGASFMAPGVCDGLGTCESGSPISCAPFMCKDGACRGHLHQRRRLRAAQQLHQRQLRQEGAGPGLPECRRSVGRTSAWTGCAATRGARAAACSAPRPTPWAAA